MAKVQYYLTTYSAAAYKSFFDSLNCPLLTTEADENNYFNLYVGAVEDNILKFQGPRYGVAGLYVKGTNVTDSNWGVDLPITVCYTDKLFFMYTRNSSSNIRGLSFFYEELGDMKLYGYSYSATDNSFKPLDIITLTDNVSGLQYAHSKRLNYTASTGYIEYVPHQLFQSGVITNINDNNFISCSTIAANQSVTIAGKNYYSIGTNTLVEIDS